MLNEEYIEKLIAGSGEIAKNLHDAMIRTILQRFIARCMKTGNPSFSAIDRYQINVLQEAGYALADLEKLIAQFTKLQIKEIRRLLREAGIETLRQDDEIYEQAGMAKSPMSAEMTRIIAFNYERSLQLWRNYTQTTARSGQEWFIKACDTALPLIQSGGMSYTEAILDAVRDLPNRGLEVVYPTGHKDQIEVATLRAVRTTVAQTSGQITAQRANENGIHLFLTSARMGARPEHEKWQGKVFYVDWEKLAQKIPINIEPMEDDYDLKAQYPDFVDETKIGTVTGLHGVNCRHSYMPYIEGVSYSPFEDIDPKKNAEAYKLSQKARAMERSIRADKRELTSVDDALKVDPQNRELLEERNKVIGRLRKKTAQYYAFCKEHDIQTNEVRLAI